MFIATYPSVFREREGGRGEGRKGGGEEGGGEEGEGRVKAISLMYI